MIDAIRRHIALYASPARLERDAYLLALARSLDELAHAYHQLSAAAPADGPDVPQEDRRKLRQLVLERFPELSADGGEQIAWTSDSRDPIDDAADLLSQMRESVWRWEHLGATDAAWHLQLLYGHWFRHLINLRSFLHARLTEW